MESEAGKMTSQERFWQARLMSKEAEHRGELSAIHRQLEALKATTEDAKADLSVSSCRVDKVDKMTLFPEPQEDVINPESVCHTSRPCSPELSQHQYASIQ